MLNREEIKKDPQRLAKIKALINRCNWEGINFPSEKDDWKRFEKTDLSITINVYMLKMKKYILLMF